MKASQDDLLTENEENRLDQLKQILKNANVNYEILTHDETIISAEDGVKSGIGNLAEMAPTMILETEKGFIAAIISGRTRLSYKKIKKMLGLKNISLAKPDEVLQVTGAEVGTVSLVNLELPTIIDSLIMDATFVYGGCGVPRHTLRIGPSSLITVTQAKVFDFTESKEESSK